MCFTITYNFAASSGSKCEDITLIQDNLFQKLDQMVIIRDSSVPNLELEALIEMQASFVCSYVLFLYKRYEAGCLLTDMVCVP